MIDEDFQICGSFNAELYKQYDGQRTVNLYEELDEEGKKVKALLPTPGLKKLIKFNAGHAMRALFEHKENFYAAASNVIYRINNVYFSYEITSPTRLKTVDGFVSIDANEKSQIIFVDGAGGYVYNADTSAFTQITDPNFPVNPTFVIYFDGYFIVNNFNTAQFNVSQTNDGLTWSPLRQFSLTSKPDVVIGFAQVNRRLIVFGRFVSEIWYSNPRPNETASNPLLRDNNILINAGCASARSIATGYGVVVWLSNNDEGNNMILLSQGGNASPVSTRQLEQQINKYKVVNDAIGFLYKMNGHLFYQLTFPSEKATWQLDLTTKKIHELQGVAGDRFIANCHAYFNATSQHLVGAYNSPTIYHYSADYSDYDGDPIRRLRISKHFIDPAYRRLRIVKIQIDLVNGMAAANGEDADPSMFLGISDDGGVSFPVYLRGSIAKLGEFKKRIVWYRLGGFNRDAVFMLDFYHKLPFVVLGGSITYDVKPK